MEPAQKDKLEGIIEELAGFSGLDLFGHLFDLRPGLTTVLRAVEEYCGAVLGAQLRRDYDPAGTASGQGNLTLLQSRLEQALAVLFSTHSAFWERFYARQNAGTQLTIPAGHLFNISGAEAQQVARTRYPSFYTVIDVLQYSSAKDNQVYSLIQLSMQCYLKASLLCISDPRLAQESYAQSLSILGPVDVSEYRQLLAGKMEASW